MAILTGPEIKKQVTQDRIRVDPFVPENCGPNSLDLRLHQDLKVYEVARYPLMRHGAIIGDEQATKTYLDMRADNPTLNTLTIPEDGLILLPGVLYLARTIERLGSDYYVPIVEGRSSVGRLGIQVHVTAGFCDLGFFGSVTLEVSVIHPVRVYAGERVCQVYFEKPVGNRVLYQGRYQGQVDPTSSRMHLGDLTEKT